LLLLRIAIGATLVAQGAAYIFQPQDLRIAFWIVCVLALTSGFALLLGLLTPIVSILAVLLAGGVGFSRLPAPTGNFGGNPLALDVIVMAIAIVFLGPGAFSLDALLFGRRKVIIPRSSPSPRS
jgi:uncharacterized membrane protein YphA (DoxX/SURF4 family)